VITKEGERVAIIERGICVLREEDEAKLRGSIELQLVLFPLFEDSRRIGSYVASFKI